MYRADHLFALYNQYGIALRGMGHAVTAGYLVGRADPTIEAQTAAERCVFFDVDRARLKGARVSLIRKLVAFCRAEKFDAVICHRYKPFTVMALASLFLPPFKLYAVVHTNGQFARFGRRALAFLFRRRVTYVAVSEGVRQDLLKSLWRQPEDSVVTLSNVVDIEKNVAEHAPRAVARAQLGIAADAFAVGTIGRLVKVKAQADLIRAFALCRAQMPGARLVIIGGGPLGEALKRLARELEVEDGVVFAGEIKEARRLLKAFDVFVLSSLREGQGLVLLEAMAARLPVVVSDIPGVAEALGPWTVRVPPQSPEQLAEALARLYRLNAGERARLGDAGFEHLARTFHAERFAGRLAAFLVS